MKIAVNTRLLLKDKLDGIGRFSAESLRLITQNHPEHQFLFIFDRPFDDSFIFSSNIEPIVINLPTRHPFLWKIWFDLLLPPKLKKHNPDLFFSPDGWLSLKTNTPSLPVIHDLNFEHYPEHLPPSYRKYYRKYFPQFARKAVRIATVSEFSKRDLVNEYELQAEKIDVVHNGPNPNFKPVGSEMKKKIQHEFSGGKPFLLFVSTIHPRKNIVNLLKAFEEFCNKSELDFCLILAGHKMWWTTEMENTLNNMKHKTNVVFTGRVSEEKLNQLMGTAEAFVYPSLFEGFGIPVLEAMQAGTPVITSESTSMPEVGGKAALYVNPDSPESIANQMLKITGNEHLRSELIEKGKIQASRFSWEKTADKLWESITKAIDEA